MSARAAVASVVLVLSLSVAKPAHAYRPFDGTDADVAELGEFELELGPIGYLRASHDSALIAPAIVANFGILPRWELVIEGENVVGLDVALSPRFLDGGVFLKHTLREGSLQQKTGISLATEFGMLLPTSDATSDAGVYLAFIASQAWRDFYVHINVALSRSSDRQNDLFVGAILEGVPRSRVRPVAELYLDDHAGVVTPSILVGAIWHASGHFSFDAATRAAWSNGAPLFEVRAGLTWTISFKR